MKLTSRRLAELCNVYVETINPKCEPEREFWYVDISAVDNVTKKITTPQKVSGKQASVRARQIIRTNDVLVATTRPNLNAVALVPKQYDGQVSSTGFCVLRCGVELDPNYLYCFVQSRVFIDTLVDLVKGALYPAVTDRQVLLQEMPWCSLDEQRRIAAELNTQLAAVEEARLALKAQIENLTELGNAIVRESISHPDAISYLLGDVLDEVKRGVGKTWAAYPVLGATRAGLAPAKEGVGKYPEKYKPVLNGTLFYNPMRILIGSIAMVDTDDTPGITSPDYVALRGRENITDTRWFYYWLRSPEGERCITSLARGAVRERMLFSRLAEGKITLPPFAVQEKASKALAEIRPLQTKLKAQLQEIELLPARLLEQAFQE